MEYKKDFFWTTKKLWGDKLDEGLFPVLKASIGGLPLTIPKGAVLMAVVEYPADWTLAQRMHALEDRDIKPCIMVDVSSEGKRGVFMGLLIGTYLELIYKNNKK